MKVDRGTASAGLLAGGLAAAAALGVPHDGMLQDTFKSAVIAFAALSSAILFVRPSNEGGLALRWHRVLLLPLLLAAYAAGSMAWAHPWQAGVEAVRWLLIALIATLAIELFREEGRRKLLARCIVAGATIASAWVVLQFLIGLELFPQGSRPASTFVNRNFFAEFAVCALPFFVFAIQGERSRFAKGMVSAAMGLVAVAVLMTGARAALVALLVLLAVAIVSRAHLKWTGVALAVVVVLGAIPTADPKIAAEARGDTAIARAFTRGAAVVSGDEATAMRIDLWSATVRMIAEHPLTGVGAAGWEHEADYHAHNEPLQLVAEYGVAGWLFLLGLGVWWVRQARRSRDPWRATHLCSLLALFIVANAGFPLHLAATGAMFALCLGALAAEDGRECFVGPVARSAAAAVLAIALGSAAYATWVAAQAESRLARAARIALSIGATSNPNDARWMPARSEMLRLVDEGMRLHPHETQLTPLVADELARWGDWPNAIRIWEHVLRSHPDRVVILTNVARGYIAIGRPDLAKAHLDRARRIQPGAPSVRAVDALMRQMSSSKG